MIKRRNKSINVPYSEKVARSESEHNKRFRVKEVMHALRVRHRSSLNSNNYTEIELEVELDDESVKAHKNLKWEPQGLTPAPQSPHFHFTNNSFQTQSRD